MRKLFIVRHGSYVPVEDKHLSQEGRRQAVELAEKIAEHVDGMPVTVISSSALRASQTAEIISQKLGVGIELTTDLLWSGNTGKVRGSSKDFRELLKLLDEQFQDCQVVILVTHYEYAECFPQFFAREKLGAVLYSRDIDKGTAWLVDCVEKRLVHIR